MRNLKKKTALLSRLGDAAYEPLRAHLEFEPGHQAHPAILEQEIAERIAEARVVRVLGIKMLEWTDGEHVYGVKIVALRPLSLADVQRLLRLGQKAADAEDARE